MSDVLVGEPLLRQRLAANLSQTQVAQEMGVTQARISHIESAGKPPRPGRSGKTSVRYMPSVRRSTYRRYEEAVHRLSAAGGDGN